MHFPLFLSEQSSSPARIIDVHSVHAHVYVNIVICTNASVESVCVRAVCIIIIILSDSRLEIIDLKRRAARISRFFFFFSHSEPYDDDITYTVCSSSLPSRRLMRTRLYLYGLHGARLRKTHCERPFQAFRSKYHFVYHILHASYRGTLRPEIFVDKPTSR